MTTWMNTLVQVRARTVKKLQMSHPLKLQRSQREQNQKIILKVPVAEGSTDHLKAQLMRVHQGFPPSQSNPHNKQWSQSLKIHHHRAAQAVTVSPQMRRRSPQRKRWRNFHHPLCPRRNTGLDLHPTQGVNVQNLDPDLVLWNKGMINETDQGLKAETIDADVASGREAVYTPGLKDPHPIQRGLGDHPTVNPHLFPQTGQDWHQDPRARAGIPATWAVAPLSEDSHLDIINDPTYQNTSVKSIHAHQTPGEDVNWIKSSNWAKFKI